VVVLKEECLVQEKQFLDKILASIQGKENITPESIQHSFYYLPVWLCLHYVVVPTLHGCAHNVQAGPTVSCCVHLLTAWQKNLGCAIFSGEIHAQVQRELQ